MDANEQKRIVDQRAGEDAYWNREHQLAHHTALLAQIGDPGATVCDVGCGYGALADLLPEGVKYLGVDRNPEKITEARLLRPASRFLVGSRPRPADTIVFAGFAPYYVAQPMQFLGWLWKCAQRTLALSGDTSCTSEETMLSVIPFGLPEPEITEHEGAWPPFWTIVLRQ